MAEKKLTNVVDEYMAQNIMDLLKEEGIESYYVPSSFGEITQVITGKSSYGYDIYVREEDFKKAEEALHYFD